MDAQVHGVVETDGLEQRAGTLNLGGIRRGRVVVAADQAEAQRTDGQDEEGATHRNHHLSGVKEMNCTTITYQQYKVNRFFRIISK